MILRILRASKKKVDKDSRGARCAGGTRISADRAGRRDRCPFEPHSCALRPISPFPALLAGLAALRAANRRQIRETLEKPRSRAQLFKRFCALGTRRGFCPAGFLPAAGNRRWAFSPPGKTEARCGLAPGKNRVRARLGAGTNPERDLLGAGAGFCLPGKTEAQRGLAPGKNRVRARLGAGTNPVRELLGAAARLAHRRCVSRRSWGCCGGVPRWGVFRRASGRGCAPWR